jgi:hypothetical protein
MSHIFNQRRDGKPKTFAWKAVPRRGKVRSPAHAVLFIKPHPRRFGRLYAASPKTHFDMSQYSRAVSPKTLQSDARYLAGWSVFSGQVTSVGDDRGCEVADRLTQVLLLGSANV